MSKSESSANGQSRYGYAERGEISIQIQIQAEPQLLRIHVQIACWARDTHFRITQATANESAISDVNLCKIQVTIRFCISQYKSPYPSPSGSVSVSAAESFNFHRGYARGYQGHSMAIASDFGGWALALRSTISSQQPLESTKCSFDALKAA